MSHPVRKNVIAAPGRAPTRESPPNTRPRAAQIILLGGEGNALAILDAIETINRASDRDRYRCIGILDDRRETWGGRIAHSPVLGPISEARAHPDARFVIAVGSPGSFFKRQDIVRASGIAPDRFETLLHPTASISASARIGPGCVLLQNVCTGTDVRVGHSCYLGAHTSVRGQVRIGDTCLTGMGEVVLKDVPSDSVVVGNPARYLRPVIPTPIRKDASSK